MAAGSQRIFISSVLVAGLAVGVAVIVWSPNLTLTRSATLDGPVETVVDDENLFRQRQEVIVGDAEPTGIVVSVVPGGDRSTIMVWFEQPRPALYGVEVRFLTSAPGAPTPGDIWLATPSGDWPPIWFGTTWEGDVRYETEGLGPDGRGTTSTTTLDFRVPHAGVDNMQDQPLAMEMRVVLQSEFAPVRSWEATTLFELPLGERPS